MLSLLDLPMECIYNITSRLSLNDWLNCRKSSRIFHVNSDKEVQKKMYMLKIITKYIGIPYDGIRYAVKVNDLDLVFFFIYKCNSLFFAIVNVIELAIIDKNLPLIGSMSDFIIKNGCDPDIWNHCLYYSKIYNNDDLVNYFVSMGANLNSYTLEYLYARDSMLDELEKNYFNTCNMDDEDDD